MKSFEWLNKFRISDIDDYQLRFGIAKLETRPFHHRKISKLVIHPRFEKIESGFDFTLLKLDHSIHFQYSIMPICLPTENEDFTGKC